MRKALGLLVVVLIVALLVIFIRQDDSASDTADMESGNSAEPQVTDPGANSSKTQNSSYKVSPVEIQQLEADMVAANTAVTLAETKLDDLSQQLDLIEAQVRDIEARGDDPAEYAEEVMPYMQPVLDEFLDAEAALDAALEQQQAATSAMKDAIQRQ